MRRQHLSGMAAATVSSLAIVNSALAQDVASGGYPCGPHMMGWNGGWSGIILGPLFMILFPLVLVVAVLIALRRLGLPSTGPSSAPPPSPLDILKERFARGEVDKEEYDERRRILSEGEDAR